MLNLGNFRPPVDDKDNNGLNNSAVLRVTKDINDLSKHPGVRVHVKDPMNFVVSIEPQEGFYRGGVFEFTFAIPQNYPHDAPKVRCKQTIYHPNIDTDGAVCLNLLRDDWKPVLTIEQLILGLIHLFTKPNPDDPLNKEAAEVLKTNKSLFKENVDRTMRGCRLRDLQYDNVLVAYRGR